MIPDFEQQMSERMEQASLKELMPGFDKEQEWQLLAQKLAPAKTKRLIPVWSYAAAILLLLVGGIWFMKQQQAQNQQVLTKNKAEEGTPVPAPDNNEYNTSIAVDTIKDTITLAQQAPPIKTTTETTNKRNGLAQNTIINYTTRDYICNNTPCPLQICISQIVQCPNIQPKAVSTCSTLEPDQSGHLNYRAHDSIAKNCSLTIKEIEITSVATGETILLNETSSPSTAQDVFSYITGKKKGDVLAGMFSKDCDHKTKKHGVRLNNKYGDLMIQ